MANAAQITEVLVSPKALSNLSTLNFSCVVTDAGTGAVLAAGVTATAIVTRSDETAITASPISLSASGGKYVANSTLTAQAGVGRLKVVIKAVYNALNTYSQPEFVEVVGNRNSAY